MIRNESSPKADQSTARNITRTKLIKKWSHFWHILANKLTRASEWAHRKTENWPLVTPIVTDQERCEAAPHKNHPRYTCLWHFLVVWRLSKEAHLEPLRRSFNRPLTLEFAEGAEQWRRASHWILFWLSANSASSAVKLYTILSHDLGFFT